MEVLKSVDSDKCELPIINGVELVPWNHPADTPLFEGAVNTDEVIGRINGEPGKVIAAVDSFSPDVLEELDRWNRLSGNLIGGIFADRSDRILLLSDFISERGLAEYNGNRNFAKKVAFASVTGLTVYGVKSYFSNRISIESKKMTRREFLMLCGTSLMAVVGLLALLKGFIVEISQGKLDSIEECIESPFMDLATIFGSVTSADNPLRTAVGIHKMQALNNSGLIGGDWSQTAIWGTDHLRPDALTAVGEILPNIGQNCLEAVVAEEEHLINKQGLGLEEARQIAAMLLVDMSVAIPVTIHTNTDGNISCKPVLPNGGLFIDEEILGFSVSEGADTREVVQIARQKLGMMSVI